MSVEHQEHVQVIQDGDYARRQRVVEYSADTRNVIIARLSRLFWLITGVITALIAFRFALKLIAANPVNDFVRFVYGLTDVLMAPFIGAAQTPAFDNGSIVDTASILAIIVYILGTWVLVSLLRILFTGRKGLRRVSTFERQS